MLAALLALTATPSPASAQAFTPNEQAEILSALNGRRAHVVDTSADLLPMLTWDPQLEAIAQRWAFACTPDPGGSGLLAHNPNRSVGYATSVGENIAGSPERFNRPYTVLDLVNMWINEARDYNVADTTCAGAPHSIHSDWKRCGHYTQVVWASTTKVGCGRSVCPNLKFGATVICDFANSGNTYDPRTGMLDRPYRASATAAESRPPAPRQ